MSRFWLQLRTPIDLVNTILVTYKEGSTKEYEESFDAKLIVEGPDSFYSDLGGEKYIIQGRGYPFDNSDKIDLGTSFHDSGIHTISIANKEGIFANGQSIFLYDKLTNVYTDLQKEDYLFEAQPGTDINRFQIMYIPSSTLGTGVITKKQLLVYQKDDNIIIDSPDDMKKVIISDATGKMIYQTNVNGKSAQINSSKYNTGMYYVSVETVTEKMTKKIIKK